MTSNKDDAEREKPVPAKFLIVDNSVLYNELRSSIVSPESWRQDNARATCDLSTATRSLIAMATIGPEPGASPSDSVLEEWKLRVADYVLTKLDDLNADLLDAICATWLQRCSSPDQMTIIRADDFFRYRGLRPRGNCFWTEQKREIAARMTLLSNTWINLHEAETYLVKKNGDREKQRKLKSRAIVVSSIAEEETATGLSDYAWKVRPGDLFVQMILSKSGKQLALMSQKILEYDYYRHTWEKRCARYFTWLHRIRQGRGEYLKGIRISSVLTAVRKKVDLKNPSKTKERLEQALDRLCQDGVIGGWQYQNADESIVGRKGWWHEWLNWCLLIEPIQMVLDQYDKIKFPAARLEKIAAVETHTSLTESNLTTLVEQMRQKRIALGLTQLQLAEVLGGIAPNYLATIERGLRRPSGKLQSTIIKWLAL